jgi:hypothetical protein
MGSNPLHHRFFEHPILFRTAQVPSIPREMREQIGDLIATVREGPPIFDRWVGALFAAIRGNPALRRPARLALRAVRAIRAQTRRLVPTR